MTGGARFKKGTAYSKKRVSPDDDDSAPRTFKKAKSGVAEEDDVTTPFVPQLQKDEQGDYYVPLKSNGLRRVTIGDFKGNTMIGIREYYTNDAGKLLPGKKGISLTLEQYNALMSAVPLIESVLTKKGDKVIRPNFDGDASPVEQRADQEEADVKPSNTDEQDEDDDE
ncbi:uncharacterized protein EI97DRAFT_382525 [Westerdykella ornata]|uniref:Transcriptional coactivator p15 (PC4) C-terminal domain-containing protein n=1 Tax=Westerdykella ornata TaxID=318751 RepID=A0A6A6JCE7_WESOR|nr:uncharacterized protein EI97DRAFT_382525 [Westerdykella ornata]KAF2273894.1 hypothetical protein EI97DRAFT_382525 [Westerdykella ornata]